MFEGKPPQSGEPRPLGTESGEGDSLRPLSWDDLVARLSAAREFRDSLGGSARACESSFDAGSARLIAAHHNGKHLVIIILPHSTKHEPGTPFSKIFFRCRSNGMIIAIIFSPVIILFTI